jgi:putative transposase
MKEATSASPAPPSRFAFRDWFDPLEEAVRSQVRWLIEPLLEEELEAALGRGRYQRGARSSGRRHGHRPRQLVTRFGPLSLSVPRARLVDEAGEPEWKSAVLPAYKRLSRRAEALIAETYLAGVNTRRVRRALQTLFAGQIGKDIVSRAWQRTRSAWQAWQERDLAGDAIVRLILEGAVVRVRLDRKATAISLLIAMGSRRDGQKARRSAPTTEVGAGSQARLAIKKHGRGKRSRLAGGSGSAAGARHGQAGVDHCRWRQGSPSGPGEPLERRRDPALHGSQGAQPARPRPQAPARPIKAEFNDMTHASTAEAVLSKRKAFLAKWKLRWRAVADRLEEAGERRFTFLRDPPEQWRALRTPNAIERRHEEFKRRIKTQCLLPCAETAAMLFWALLASGQITMRRVDGWPTLDRSPADLDLAA